MSGRCYVWPNIFEGISAHYSCAVTANLGSEQADGSQKWHMNATAALIVLFVFMIGLLCGYLIYRRVKFKNTI